uniref:Uncharacterized protein n=1 Tax=Ficedula albicollis TaxID=59894 RepID=A0A803VWY5_FICAL
MAAVHESKTCGKFGKSDCISEPPSLWHLQCTGAENNTQVCGHCYQLIILFNTSHLPQATVPEGMDMALFHSQGKGRLRTCFFAVLLATLQPKWD